jgi:hypothetical protein
MESIIEFLKIKKKDSYDKTSFETMWEKATCGLKDIIFCGFLDLPFSL